MLHHQHHHNTALVYLSVIIAIFSSYIALDLANSLALSKGRARWIWLSGGSLAMGIGIWSMHFVAMLAFSLPSITIAYDVPLLILSILVAIGASALTLLIVSGERISIKTYIFGSLTMGAAIAGMHYIGIASMRMAAKIHWDMNYVYMSLVIAVVASFVALLLAFKLRNENTRQGILFRLAGGTIMGFAISGMHYTAMAAMSFTASPGELIKDDQLLATTGLAIGVIVGTIIILTVALSGSIIDRALSRRIEISDALEATVKSRDEFLSIVSHELKTPLTSMKINIQLSLRTLLSLQSIDEEKKSKLESMLAQADKSIVRITRLVDDMLDISRISTGKLGLQLEEFNLSETVSEVVERLSPLLGDVEILDAKEVKGQWDKFRIEQVVTNLLTNAAKYGEKKPIEVRVSQTAKHGIISVKDYGRGIALENQVKIFQRFQRIKDTDQISGLGIGLFIVSEIVQMHKGSIEVKSELHHGAEFIVTLPLIVDV